MKLKIKRPNKQKIQEFLKSDRAILMICIGIALIFWLLVKLSQDFGTTLNLNAAYQLPQDKTFLQTPPSSITATVKGNGWDLLGNYFSAKKTIELNLPDVPEYTFSSNVLKDLIRTKLPNTIEVNQVSPEYLQLRLEPKKAINVPVIHQTELSFSSQYHLKAPVYTTPDSVWITGPSSITDTITQWKTTLLKLENLQSTYQKLIPLIPPASTQLSLDPGEVMIQVPVEQITEKIVFIPISILNAPDSLKIFPEKIKISSTVGLSNYDSIHKDQFKAVVDFNQVKGSETPNNSLPISLSEYPTLVESIHYTPKSVEYFFVQPLESDSTKNPTSKVK